MISGIRHTWVQILALPILDLWQVAESVCIWDNNSDLVGLLRELNDYKPLKCLAHYLAQRARIQLVVITITAFVIAPLPDSVSSGGGLLDF